jgi:hypothetical protein
MGTPRRSGWLVLLVLVLLALVAPAAASAGPRHGHATAHRLVAGLEGGAGSTIGPDGALYVTETAAGRITRVDPKTGATTTYASGLPTSIIGLGGAMDIAFLGRTAYVCWSPWSAPTSAAATWSGSTGWTGRTASPWLPTSAPSPSTIRLPPHSTFPADSSTRWRPIAVGSW